jgi:holo-[acyl-carrier protein] synthase
MPGRLSVGVDLVRVSDVARSLDQFGERYVQRLYTSAEAAYCGRGTPAAASRFAARFAAKEATLKALRSVDGTMDWRNIEVRRDATGWCDVVLHGSAAELAERNGVTELSLSMSHEADYATAVVIATGAFERKGSEPDD